MMTSFAQRRIWQPSPANRWVGSRRWIAVGWLVIGGWWTTTPAMAQQAVRVILKPQAVCRETVITLGHIADIESSDPSRSMELAKLDIADFPQGEESLRITRTLVDVRLRLKISDAHEVHVLGSDRVWVTRPTQRFQDDWVISQLQQAFAEAWSVEPAMVQVKLLQPLDASHFTTLASDLDLDTALPANPRPGTNRIKLLIREHGRLVRTSEALVAAQMYADQLIAKADLPRGHVLETNDLTTRRQLVTGTEQCVSYEAVVGKQLTIPMRTGQVISARHVVDHTQLPPDAVKPRDRVRLVLRKGNLTVTLAGAEVLQRGAVGDQVQVRNPESKKVIVARVVSSDEVTIKL